MNKKTKNIVSVIQSVAKNLGGTQWMPSGSLTALHMTKSTLYSVLCTLCTVLFLASCTDESLVDNPHAQNAFRTVSVDLGMPQGKPAFGEGTTSRAALDTQTAEILLGDSTLAVSRAEGAEGGTSYYTTLPWEDGDGLLVKIDAGTTQGRLMLKYIDADDTEGWFLVKNMSLFKYTGDTYYWYEGAEELPEGVLPIVEVNESEENIVAIDISKPITIHIDWNAGVTVPEVSIYYIQNESMTWDDTGKLIYYWGATEAPEMWTLDTDGKWTTSQARLRVHTGVEGDEVKLTSSAFDTASDDEAGEYIAYTDKDGNAYFYGATSGQLTDDFLVELTQMCVPVQTPSGSQTGGGTESVSEGRSIELDNYSKEFFTITLDTPITLLEASDVVPVTLAADQAYKLMADVKRTASAKANLSVIDGQCGITEVTDGLYVGTDAHVAAVKAQIETAVAMGVTDFTVVNQLAVYNQFVVGTNAFTVVGEAIRQIGAANSDARISLTLSDATMVIMCGFYGCTALQSVSAPAATVIGEGAFYECTALQSVSASVATVIENSAFYGCTALQSVSASVATVIGGIAFYNCSNLQSVTLGEVTNIGTEAFSNTQVTNLNFDYVKSLGSNALSGLTYANLEMGKKAASDATITLQQNAFEGCTLTGSVTFHQVVGKEGQVDGLTEGNAFNGVATSGLDLFLHADQPLSQISISDDGTNLKWAGAAWKSITLLDGPNGTAGTKYYIDNGMPTVEVDGTCGITGNNPIGEETHVSAMEQKIKVVAVAATANAPAKVIVKKGLASFGGLPKTVVGNAINRGYVHLVLDDAITSIPKEAFENNGVLVSVTTSATTIGESAFYGCSSLTNVSLRATSATTIGEIAFMACSHLATVDLSANTAIGESAFKHCYELTGMDWTKVTSIGVEAFLSCSSLTSELSLPNVTSIGDASFKGCIFTKVTFGKVVTGYESAFTDAAVSNCDLELAAGQTGVTASSGNLMWAGAVWNSINLKYSSYKADNNNLYLKVEPKNETYDEDKVSWLNSDIIHAYQNGVAGIWVTGELDSYKTSSAVGKAISLLNDKTMSDGQPYEITLILDEATSIPNLALANCKALNTVVANSATSIGIGAFYDCTGIEVLRFKQAIQTVGAQAFGQTDQGVQPWTMECTLNLAAGQQGVENLNAWFIDSSGEVELVWAEYSWKSITIGGEPFPSAGPM